MKRARPLSPSSTLEDITREVVTAFVRDGEGTATCQIGVQLKDGRTLVIAIVAHAMEVPDLEGMLPGTKLN